MPRSATLPRSANIALKLSGIVLIIASLAWQLLQLGQLTRASAAPATLSRAPALNSPELANTPLAQLFGLPASPTTAPPSGPQLRLLACFAGSDSRQSSALLKIEQQASRRVRVGEQIFPGVQVSDIQAHSIEITRNGHPYTLRLGRNAADHLPVAARHDANPLPISSTPSPE